MKKTFSLNKAVYLHDVTSFGNVYFANYFIWQGEAREEFLKQIIPNPKDLYDAGLKLVTLDASMKFLSETVITDVVSIQVIPVKPTITTTELRFLFKSKNGGRSIGEGHQRVGFVGSEGIAVPLPYSLLRASSEYFDESELSKVNEILEKINKIETSRLIK